MAPVTSMLDHYMKIYIVSMVALILSGCAQKRNDDGLNAMKIEVSNDKLTITILAQNAIYITGNQFYGKIAYDIKLDNNKVMKQIATWKMPCYYSGKIYMIHPGDKEQYTIDVKGYAGGEINVVYNYYNNEVDLRRSEVGSVLTASITHGLTSQ